MNVAARLRLALLLLPGWSAPALAHGGGVDRCGGHNDRQDGGYHVHDWSLHCACHPAAAGCGDDRKPAPGAEPSGSVAPAELGPPSSAPRPPPSLGGNTQVESFNTAKKYAFAVHDDHRYTFYCGCTYDGDLRVDHASCGYRPRGTSDRAQRVEWEHVVPADAFGQSFAEWRDGHPTCVDRHGQAFRGRDCARKASKLFRLMEADVYNLFPAIGEVNNLRSSYSMVEISGEAREFGECDVEISDRKFEPRPAIRGDIARIYFYMDRAYPGRGIISDKNRKLFEAWDRQDPVDAWECERAGLVADMQGNLNAVLAAACAAVVPPSGPSLEPRRSLVPPD